MLRTEQAHHEISSGQDPATQTARIAQAVALPAPRVLRVGRVILAAGLFDIALMNVIAFVWGLQGAAQLTVASVIATAVTLGGLMTLDLASALGKAQAGRTKHMVRMGALAYICLAIDLAVFHLFYDLLSGVGASTVVSIQIAKLCAVAAIVLWIYMANRLWTASTHRSIDEW